MSHIAIWMVGILCCVALNELKISKCLIKFDISNFLFLFLIACSGGVCGETLGTERRPLGVQPA